MCPWERGVVPVYFSRAAAAEPQVLYASLPPPLLCVLRLRAGSWRMRICWAVATTTACRTQVGVGWGVLRVV